MEWLGENRRFQIWEYTVSHGQLLLRSPLEDGHGTRLDILFKDVWFMHLAAASQVEAIEEVGPEEVARLGGALAEEALEGGRRGYRLRGPQGDGLVVAGVVVVNEDRLLHNEPTGLKVWPMRSGANVPPAQ
ncbi:MAG: hypothetical protein GY926_15845 [bacterium]|nr:hypothetical protein [bacterium]